MSKLKAFLQKSPVGKTEEVFISDRFQDDDGSKVPFVVKMISQELNEEIVKSCTRKGKLNNTLYAKKMVVECTVEPNFKDSEVCKFYGVVDPLDVPAQMLSIGEYADLQKAILLINDLVKQEEEDLEEAKNSSMEKTEIQ